MGYVAQIAANSFSSIWNLTELHDKDKGSEEPGLMHSESPFSISVGSILNHFLSSTHCIEKIQPRPLLANIETWCGTERGRHILVTLGKALSLSFLACCKLHTWKEPFPTQHTLCKYPFCCLLQRSGYYRLLNILETLQGIKFRITASSSLHFVSSVLTLLLGE